MTASADLPAAVLWDMDGTLVDSESYWIRAERAIVERFGGIWDEAHATSVVGASLDHTAALMIDAGVRMTSNEVILELSAAVQQQFHELGVPWRPGALELLADLQSAGVPCALVTMSHADNAHDIAERVPGLPFEQIISGDQVTHGKPHPEPYERALHLLGVPAQQTVAIEDSQPGLASAVAAGVNAIGVACVLPLPPSANYLLWESLAGKTTADLTNYVRTRGAS